MKNKTIALLTASGKGTRMGQDIPKQFIHVNNKPIIIYTMQQFQDSPLIDEICVVTLPNWIEFIRAYAKQFNITKLTIVTEGGETGQDSIHNGLISIREKYQHEDVIIMIHDGNRPMIDDDIISDSIATYKKYGSAVAAIPCVEAIFESDNSIDSTKSIPRDKLFRTQTPHTYNLNKLLWAHEEAKKRNITSSVATCTLMNQLDEKIYFSKGNEKNIKLTTLADIDIFIALLNVQKDNWLK